MASVHVTKAIRRLLEMISFPQADPRLLGVARMCFAFLGFCYLVGVREFSPFLWQLSQPSAALAFWAASLCLLFVGLGGALTAVVHFIAVLWIGECIGPRVGFDFFHYRAIAFWLCFAHSTAGLSLDAIRNKPQSVPSWPLYMLGMNLGLWLLSGGVLKACDPLWTQGTGFYFAFLMPWTHDPCLGFLLDWSWLMLGANWCVMIAELLWLPLFVMPATRWVAIILAVCFYASLIFIMRLSLIGECGLVACLALASMTDWPRGEQAPRHRLTPTAGATFLVSCALVGLCFLHAHSVWATGRPFPSTLAHALTIVNSHTVSFFPNYVFTAENTLHRHAYRVVFTLDDGAAAEPALGFREDLSPAGYFEQRLLRPLILPSEAVGLACERFGREGAFSAFDQQTFQSIHDQAFSLLSKDARTKSRGAKLMTKPMLPPDSYQGSVKPWQAVPWRTIVEWDDRGAMRIASSGATP
jgi:hypothetical protein